MSTVTTDGEGWRLLQQDPRLLLRQPHCRKKHSGTCWLAPKMATKKPKCPQCGIKHGGICRLLLAPAPAHEPQFTPQTAEFLVEFMIVYP